MKKVAIITGVSQGLGASLAERFIDSDFQIIGLGRRNHPSLEHPQYQYLECDFQDAPASVKDRIEPLFKQIAKSGPSTIILLNNAGAAEPYGRIGDLDYSLAERVMRVNTVGPIVLADVFCRVFKKLAVLKSIVNISSGAAARPIPGASIYCMSKSALEMLTLLITEEQKLEEHPINSIGIRPGIIDTPMQTAARGWPKEKYPAVDLFQGFFIEKKLIPPKITAQRIANWIIQGAFESGRIYNIDDI